MRTTTPILDQVVPLPDCQSDSTPAIWPVLILFAELAVVLLQFVFMRVNPVYTLLIITLAGYASGFWHECGHAAAALLLGFRLKSFHVRPVKMEFTGRCPRLKLYYAKHSAGSVSVLARRRGVTRWTLLLLFTAGPLAEFVLLLFLVTQWRWWLQVAPLWYLPLTVVCATAMAGNLIPREKGQVVSDGARILQLTNGNSAPAYCALFELIGLVHSGIRPAMWDPQLVLLARSGGKYRSDRFIANLLAHDWACAHRDRNLAADCLESALSVCAGLPAAARRQLFQRAALVQSVCRKPQIALVWLDRANHPESAVNAGPHSWTLLSPSDRRSA
jgi:hypothetical protein